jgi:hypothetical protein
MAKLIQLFGEVINSDPMQIYLSAAVLIPQTSSLLSQAQRICSRMHTACVRSSLPSDWPRDTKTLNRIPSPVDVITISQDDSYLAARLSNGNLLVYDLVTSRLLASRSVTTPVISLNFILHSTRLICRAVTRVAIRHPMTLDVIGWLNCKESLITCAATSPDGNCLAIGYTDGEIMLWQASDLRNSISLLTHSRSLSLLQFSHCSTLLASFANSDRNLCVWNVLDGTLHSRCTSDFGVEQMTFALMTDFDPEDHHIVYQYRQDSVRIFHRLWCLGAETEDDPPDTELRGHVSVLYKLNDVTARAQTITFTSSNDSFQALGPVAKLYVSPRGTYMVCTNTTENTMQIFGVADLLNSEVESDWEAPQVRPSVSADGRYWVQFIDTFDTSTVKVYRTSTTFVYWSFAVDCSSKLKRLSLATDDTGEPRVLLVRENGCTELWSFSSSETRSQIPHDFNSQCCVFISADARWLGVLDPSSMEDAKLGIWSSADSNLLTRIACDHREVLCERSALVYHRQHRTFCRDLEAAPSEEKALGSYPEGSQCALSQGGELLVVASLSDGGWQLQTWNVLSLCPVAYCNISLVGAIRNIQLLSDQRSLVVTPMEGRPIVELITGAPKQREGHHGDCSPFVFLGGDGWIQYMSLHLRKPRRLCWVPPGWRPATPASIIVRGTTIMIIGDSSGQQTIVLDTAPIIAHL